AAIQGAHVLSADVTAEQDTFAENNRAQAALVVKPLPKVLLIDQQARQGDAVAAALSADRIEVDRRDPSGVPVRGAELSEYEAVVLVDVQATALSLDQQLTLQSYVRDMGHGLLVVGGQNSF